MFDIRMFALNQIDAMIRRDPSIMQNPQKRAMIDAIRNNDSRTGQEIAGNLCNTFGVSKEDATNNAYSMFFGRNNQNGRR